MESGLLLFRAFFERRYFMNTLADHDKLPWTPSNNTPFNENATSQSKQSIITETDQELSVAWVTMMEPDSNTLDHVSSDTDTDASKSMPEPHDETAAENAKRTDHEKAEAKRKAEWEAKQQAKKVAEQEHLNHLKSMGDHDVIMASVTRIGTDTEKLTRRNMKDCVSEHIQTRCLCDSDFARLTMHPRKTMIRCFRFINRKAREFVEQEMKDNDVPPENGIYGSDVPDDLCYQWAEDYFRDMSAPEDIEKEEEFVPKPYVGKYSSKSKKTTVKQKLPVEDESPSPKQFSLFDFAKEEKANDCL